MKRKIAIVIYIIIIVITIYMLFNIAINSDLIVKYNWGFYIESEAKILTNINFQKSYIANYNYGNVLYQKGDYEDAIAEYKKALKTVISSDNECKIRINCALAFCKTVQLDESNQIQIENAIEIYESAIEVLTENDCDNHNQDAQQLKKDIQDEIDRLKKLLNNTEDEKDDSNDEEDEEQDSEETMEEKLQEIKEEATNEQRNKETKYKNYNKSYNARNKNW